MKLPNSFVTEHKCRECKLKSHEFFCNFPEGSLGAFESLKVTNSYPKGTTLFVEGQPANGIYMLCQGRIKLSTYSRDGKALILQIAEPGEVLGLSSTVSDIPHEATAEVLESCQVNFIRKTDFLRFLQQHPEASLKAVMQLSRNYHKAYTQICSLGLSTSVADKLAKLFLEWCESHGRPSANGNGSGTHPIRIKMGFTHEEIAEMIGTSRETVTRLLKDFRERGLIEIKGADLVISNIGALERSIGAWPKARHV